MYPINDQQLLRLALDFESTKNYDLEGISGEIIVYYAERQTTDNSDEAVLLEVKQMITGHILDKMVQDGIVEESLDGYYSITEEGKKLVQTQD